MPLEKPLGRGELAQLLDSLGPAEEAIAAYEAAVAARPEDLGARLALADAREALGQPERVLEQLEAARALMLKHAADPRAFQSTETLTRVQ